MRPGGKLAVVLLGLASVGLGLAWLGRRARRESGVRRAWRQEPFRAAGSLSPHAGDLPGVLDLADENLTITQRVRTNLGREPALAGVPHLNVNTEPRGVVYLRGLVQSEEQRRAAARVAASTAGVSAVVNELTIERAVGG